jgi:hypothetical protein
MKEGAVFGNPPKALFSRWRVHVELVVGAGGEEVPVSVTLLASWLRLKRWDETNAVGKGRVTIVACRLARLESTIRLTSSGCVFRAGGGTTRSALVGLPTA